MPDIVTTLTATLLCVEILPSSRLCSSMLYQPACSLRPTQQQPQHVAAAYIAPANCGNRHTQIVLVPFLCRVWLWLQACGWAELTTQKPFTLTWV